MFRLYFIEATKGGIWVPLALLLASFSCQMIWNFHEFLVGYWTEASAEDELNEVAEAELLLDAAESCGIVDRKGAWYGFGETRLGQGRPGFPLPPPKPPAHREDRKVTADLTLNFKP